MSKIYEVLYTGRTHTTGARSGVCRSSDGQLDVKLSVPGSSIAGTNPEQLFAAGWSACFEGAMQFAARKKGVSLPRDIAIDAEIDLCKGDDAFFLRARLNINVVGIEREIAQAIIDTAHQSCPYSKAIRGNIDVVITLVD
jgi:lipoyl-dependent peroxiredoxin